MIAFHPSSQELLAFSDGSLVAGSAVAIAAHLDYCPVCSGKSARLEAESAQLWNEVPESTAVDLDALAPILDAILNAPLPEEFGSTAVVAKQPAIEIGGQRFKLPPVLARVAEGGLKWLSLPGGVSLAKVKVDNETLCTFLYMKPGGKVGMHTHEGTETTLVIGGSFFDASGRYREGDFVQRSDTDTHTSESEEGCLCFTVQDNPVVFTSRFARLLNPINRYLMRH